MGIWDRLAEGAQEMGRGGGQRRGDVGKKGRTARLRANSDTEMVNKLSTLTAEAQAKSNPVIREALRTGDYTVSKNTAIDSKGKLTGKKVIRIRPDSHPTKDEAPEEKN